MKIKISLSEASIDAAIKQLEQYQTKVANAGAKIAERLANIGYEVAWGIMAENIYSGETISSLQVYQESENKFILRAGSVALLFFEFGAGVTFGDGHENPQVNGTNMGPGTYPGQTHANDPKGWWFPTDDANLAIRTDKDGQMWGHSYGNPPHMPFYRASQKIRAEVLNVAREVFQSD